jgi:tetratricopeptide (TPR) repeat protein
MGVATADELLRLGREALAVADWKRARAAFEQAAAFGESAEVLDGLGEALQFSGEQARAIELKERAFAGYERRGRRAEAAELARWLAFLHVSVHGNVAAANGWMARAESLLDGMQECAAHGWLTLDRAPWTSDASERERLAMAAIAIARRYGDRDLEFDAMALLGEAYVASGRVTEGMRLLDEAMAAVSSGEVVGVGPAGEIYCRLLSACERATDVRRAEQWLAAATRFEAWGDFVPPTCRTHYGGILIVLGRWEEAERELLAAIRIFETGYWASQLFALLRLADLRVRQHTLRLPQADSPPAPSTHWRPPCCRGPTHAGTPASAPAPPRPPAGRAAHIRQMRAPSARSPAHDRRRTAAPRPVHREPQRSRRTLPLARIPPGRAPSPRQQAPRDRGVRARQPSPHPSPPMFPRESGRIVTEAIASMLDPNHSNWTKSGRGRKAWAMPLTIALVVEAVAGPSGQPERGSTPAVRASGCSELQADHRGVPARVVAAHGGG